MSSDFLQALRRVFRGSILTGEPLSRHTTWRIGGPAEFFAVPEDRADLAVLAGMASQAGVPWLTLGMGSNLLVRDGGMRGVVIHTARLQHLTFQENGLVRAGGGLPLMRLIMACARMGWRGLEPLTGIPGTVGGAIAMNAGAAGLEIGQLVRQVLLIDASGERTCPAETLAFGYRRSAIGAAEVVAEVELLLEGGAAAPALAEVEAKLVARRAAQAVEGPNAGSVFKNPPGAKAWQLIDQAGLRGLQVGGAQVALEHANFIVNRGGASARDVLRLIELIRQRVQEVSGILLEPEIRVVGQDTEQNMEGAPADSALHALQRFSR
jgi:UDP-N-acetylmuramate dehydrogenase